MTIPIVCTRHEEPVVIEPVVEVKRVRHPRAAAHWEVVRRIDSINFHADGRVRLTCPECRYDVQVTGDAFVLFLILKHLESLGETQAPLRVVEAMVVSKKFKPTMRAWLNAVNSDPEEIARLEAMKRLQGVTRVTRDVID